jgi:hypothetical protein
MVNKRNNTQKKNPCRPMGRRPARRRTRQRASGAAYGDRNLPGNIYQQQGNKPTDRIHISGHDIVNIIPDINGLNADVGTQIYRIPIVPNARDLPTADEPEGPYLFPRLRSQASGYQDIKYHSLELVADGSASLTTSGSMIHSFCADAGDDVPGGREGISWAASQQCSATGKYSQCVRVKVPASQLTGPFNGSFKTSISNSDAPRTYSPGFFAGVIVNAPDAKAPISITVNWDVTVSKATTHSLADAREVRYVKVLGGIGIQGSTTADTPYDADLKFYGEPGDTGRDAVASDFQPVMLDGLKYLIPGGEITVAGNTGAAGAPQTFVASHIGLKSGKVILYRKLISTGAYVESDLQAQPSPNAAPGWQAGTSFPLDQSSGFGSQ